MPDLARSVAAVWRALRSMRTALILLLLVGAASIAGSLVPQLPVSPQRVAQLYRDRPLLARIYDGAGLFDVFGSWWFTLAYSLLLISLVSCLIPRTRALLKGSHRRPQPARELESLRHFAETTVPEAPADALERARRLFRRRRYRLSRPDGAHGIAAEKGLAREVGSLLFHWSFFLLLVGIVYGKGFGFSAQATIVEGETFTEAAASYDRPPDAGRFFTQEMHRGFQVRVLDFEVSYRDTGLPRDFVSRVDVLEDGEVARTEEIRVNRPLSHEGVKIFQAGFGWAPEIEVRQDGRPVASGPVVFVIDNTQDQRLPWHGVIKLPSLRPQVGLEFRLLPDPPAFLLGRPMLEAREPFLAFTAYRGDLRLTQAQNVFALEKEDLRPFEEGGIGIGETAELPDGLEIRFAGIRQYTQFLVSRDPGTGIALLAAVLVLLGLIPALYSSRRKLWVRAVESDGGTRLQLGGFALQRRSAFAEEFEALRRELTGAGTLAKR